MLLCNHLADLIEANGSKRPGVSPAWLRDMDRLVRLDDRDHAAVRKAIDWCQADPFWCANILSPAKLRKQYDALRLAAKRETTTSRGRRFDPDANIIKDRTQPSGQVFNL